jgi:hypothetical protein
VFTERRSRTITGLFYAIALFWTANPLRIVALREIGWLGAGVMCLATFLFCLNEATRIEYPLRSAVSFLGAGLAVILILPALGVVVLTLLAEPQTEKTFTDRSGVRYAVVSVNRGITFSDCPKVLERRSSFFGTEQFGTGVCIPRGEDRP